tara:strand:+ start:251 stop:472 length:222 start_codon:yes stop_codon:yes gene_type:complete
LNFLKIETIDQNNFSPFGDIIDKKSSSKQISINQGTTKRYSQISKQISMKTMVIALFRFFRENQDLFQSKLKY